MCYESQWIWHIVMKCPTRLKRQEYTPDPGEEGAQEGVKAFALSEKHPRAERRQVRKNMTSKKND